MARRGNNNKDAPPVPVFQARRFRPNTVVADLLTNHINVKNPDGFRANLEIVEPFEKMCLHL
jgi:hypothetical protein